MEGLIRREDCGDLPKGTLLPESFDCALIGLAERRSEIKPVYSFDLLKDSKEGIHKIIDTLAGHPDSLILYRSPAKDYFWQRVKQGELLAWELLSPAILGVIGEGLSKPSAVGYDRQAVIDMLADSVIDSDSKFNPEQIAREDYRTKLLACNAGEVTPWYIYKE